MTSPEKIFGNFFSEKSISNPRLANFANDALNRLIATNTDGNNTSLINLLNPALNRLQAELGDVDVAKGVQKGKTLSLNRFINDFKEAMGRFEGVIAYAFGGTETPGYLEFYPNGKSEYSLATKGQMQVLVSRLRQAATKHAAKLDPVIAGQLTEFEGTWKRLRDEQVQQKGNVSDNRTSRQEARTNLELVLLTLVHTVALRHPGNTEACTSYFDFSLLNGQGQKQKASGQVPVNKAA